MQRCSFLIRFIDNFGLHLEVIDKFQTPHGWKQGVEMFEKWKLRQNQASICEMEADKNTKDAAWLSHFCEVDPCQMSRDLSSIPSETFRCAVRSGFSKLQGLAQTRHVELHCDIGRSTWSVSKHSLTTDR